MPANVPTRRVRAAADERTAAKTPWRWPRMCSACRTISVPAGVAVVPSGLRAKRTAPQRRSSRERRCEAAGWLTRSSRAAAPSDWVRCSVSTRARSSTSGTWTNVFIRPPYDCPAGPAPYRWCQPPSRLDVVTATVTTENPDNSENPDQADGPRTTVTHHVRVLLLSNTIEHLAYRFTQIALPLVVLREFDSAAMAGLVGGLAGLPLITSPWWVRRLRQR